MYNGRMEKRDPDIIPGFDVLEWKREIQEEFYLATKDMTSDEFLEYFRKRNEKRREARRLCQAEPAALTESADN